jgi:hypothetical protein
MSFEDFIDCLARVRPAADAFNQYAYDVEANAVRRDNLRLYLRTMVGRRPRLLLFGEAPGYQGMRLTGLPFTSEYTLIHDRVGPDAPPIGLFGAERGYRATVERGRVRREPSGTIVWGAIARLDPLPLIWPAFPFHPFKAGNPWSNRPPRASELDLGEPFVRWVLDLFPVDVVVAVGNKAETILKRLGVPHRKVRHPSQGGKHDFVSGIDQIVQALNARSGAR